MAHPMLQPPAPPARRSAPMRAAFMSIAALVAVMWASEIADWLLPADFDQYGIVSRDLGSLPGVLLAPFLHAGFGHLLANTWPLLLLGFFIAWRNPARFWAITATVVVVGGGLLWLLGPRWTVTVGASGVVFGYLTYLLLAGLRSRSVVDILIAAGVFLIYGGTLAGALPGAVPAGVSWQAHLAGIAAGVLAAVEFAPRRTGRARSGAMP